MRMRMEGGLVEQRRGGIVGNVNSKVIKKRKFKSRRSNVGSSSVNKRQLCYNNSFALQRLYGSCKNVFNGPGVVPSPNDVQSLCSILDCMKPEDLGLSRNLPFFKPGTYFGEKPRVTCTTVYKCQNFSLVLFFLPPSAVIPLHNHPEMTVFSKLLLGTMHVKAYDWADPKDVEFEQTTSKRLATLKVDSVFTAPCNTSVLYPTSGGNIHAFTAITPCAVLDVIGPPYSKEDGRDCTYYKDTKYLSTDGSSVQLKDDEHTFGWLEEIEVPEQSKMNGIQYLGPQIIETAT